MKRPALSVLLALLLASPLAAASRVLPALRFRVLVTPHFRIYYHQREEHLARELGPIAESVRASLSGRLRLTAPSLTHVLLLDQDDGANGWATPLPYSTVMVTAAWPGASQLVGNARDWLRLVFTHEYAHILQLEQSRGWARVVRGVFGRAPLGFPNLFLPEWEVEGLATYEESRETGLGRLHGGDARAIVRERAREVGFQPLGSVSGGQVDWPGPLSPYLYGGFFSQYLAERFGEEKLGELAARSGTRLPFLASPVFRATFGRSLGDLWNDYQQTLTAAGRELAASACEAGGAQATPGGDSGPCRQLTHDGFYVATPRFVDDGTSLVYSVQTPNDLPALFERRAASDDPLPRAAPERIATRYAGEQVGVSGALVFFDQADYEVNVAWRSDLYVLDRSSRRVQRLTRGARLVAPDISPDGHRLVCVRIVNGGRQLALFRVDGSRVGQLRLAPLPLPRLEPGNAHYGSPRFSPDGRTIAAERRKPGGPSEIVTVDADTGIERVVVSSSSPARSLSPAWLGGSRRLLFASDREGDSFQLYTAALDDLAVRKLTSVAGGALMPEPAPGGTRVVYVGYTANGYDLFEIEPRHWGRESTAEAAAPPVVAATGGEVPSGDRFLDETYGPLPTLMPRAWSPAIDTLNGSVRMGASTGGEDVLGRHAFGIAAWWRLEGGANAVAGPHRARPDWSAFYTYDRWRPTAFVTASQETSFLPSTRGGARVADAELRQNTASLGVSVPFFRLPHAQTWLAAFNYEQDTLTTVAGVRRYGRNAVRTAWAFRSAHDVGYSISPEQGVTLGLASEQVRAALGADGHADAFTAELRGYRRLGGRHAVLAARIGIGAASGDASVARVFYLGGPGPASSPVDFGNDALNLLRGYEDKAFAGRHASVANVEYRVPLWRIERGRGTWPLFLRTLHAAVFVDAGQAWDHSFQWSGVVGSLGAELSLDTVVGFGLPLTFTAGVAGPWAADRGGVGRAKGYLRVGRSF